MNKKIIGAVVAVVIIAGAAFYGGTLYAKSSTPSRGAFAAGAAGQFAGRTGAAGARGAAGGGLTAGEILSNDGTSITIKMADGSTKIVLVSPSTQVMKMAAGSLSDLARALMSRSSAAPTATAA